MTKRSVFKDLFVTYEAKIEPSNLEINVKKQKGLKESNKIRIP